MRRPHRASEAAAQVAAHKSFGIALGLGPHPVLPCKLYIDILPYPSPQPMKYN